jgi:hypothetical protein
VSGVVDGAYAKGPRPRRCVGMKQLGALTAIARARGVSAVCGGVALAVSELAKESVTLAISNARFPFVIVSIQAR